MQLTKCNPHERDALADVDLKVKVLQDLDAGTARVPEVDFFEANGPAPRGVDR